jgi:hypothetical protein
MTIIQKQTTAVAYAYNTNYLESGDWEDHSSRPAQVNICKSPTQPMDGHLGMCLSSQLAVKHKYSDCASG